MQNSHPRPDWEIYKIDSKTLKPSFVKKISFNYYVSYAAINSKFLTTVYAERGKTDIEVAKYNLSTGKSEQIILVTEAQYTPSVDFVISCNESVLFFIAYINRDRFLYAFDLETNKVIYIRELTGSDLWNPNMVKLTGRDLLVTDFDFFCVLGHDVNWNYTEMKSHQLPTNDYVNCRGGSLIDGNYIFTADKEGLEGLFSFNPADNEYTTIFQPELKDDTLYNTWAIASLENDVFISCGLSVKQFRNSRYISQTDIDFEISNPFVSNLAVNSRQKIITLSNHDSFIISPESKTFYMQKFKLSGFLYTADRIEDNDFVIRTRNVEKVYYFDYSTQYLKLLFELPAEQVSFPDISVLPDGNLILNWDNFLKIFSRNGKLIKDGPVYSTGVFEGFAMIAGISYSDYWDCIIMISSSRYLFLVDKDTLEILKTFDLSDAEGQLTGIAVTDSGEIFVASINNTAYRIRLE